MKNKNKNEIKKAKTTTKTKIKYIRCFNLIINKHSKITLEFFFRTI